MVQQHRIRTVRSFQGLGGAQLISLGSQHVYLGGKGTYLLKDLSSKVEGICGKWYGRGWPIGAGLCSLVCSLFLGDLIFFIRVSLRPSNYHLNFHTDKWEISLQLFDGFFFSSSWKCICIWWGAQNSVFLIQLCANSSFMEILQQTFDHCQFCYV